MVGVENSKNLLVSIGALGSPSTPVAIGTQANGALSLSANRIDTTNKNTQNYASAIAGLRNFVVTADGFCNWPDTSGLEALVDYAVAGSDFTGTIILNSAGRGYRATMQANQLEI